MNFPIDVVFLDQTDRVISLFSHVIPWRILPLISKAHTCIELPADTIKQKNIQLGVMISWKK